MSGRIKVGYYVECSDFDANDPQDVERAKMVIAEIQEAVSRRMVAIKQNVVALPEPKEIDRLLGVMERNSWKIGQAATYLGIPREVLYQKLYRWRQRGLVTSSRDVEGETRLRWQRTGS